MKLTSEDVRARAEEWKVIETMLEGDDLDAIVAKARELLHKEPLVELFRMGIGVQRVLHRLRPIIQVQARPDLAWFSKHRRGTTLGVRDNTLGFAEKRDGGVWTYDHKPHGPCPRAIAIALDLLPDSPPPRTA